MKSAQSTWNVYRESHSYRPNPIDLIWLELKIYLTTCIAIVCEWCRGWAVIRRERNAKIQFALIRSARPTSFKSLSIAQTMKLENCSGRMLLISVALGLATHDNLHAVISHQTYSSWCLRSTVACVNVWPGQSENKNQNRPNCPDASDAWSEPARNEAVTQ